MQSRRDFLTGTGLGAAVVGTGALAWHEIYPPIPRVNLVELKLEDHAKPSFAQFGEDLVVWTIFKYLKIEKPSYLDIGAYHPVDSNNTYLFYRNGCTGVLVEPNPEKWRTLKAVRPNDTSLNIGIGENNDAGLDFYILTDDQHNTFDKKQADEDCAASNGKCKIERVIKIPVRNINDVISEQFKGKTPDYVSIDVQGWELKILKSLDLKRFRPPVICVETLVPNTNKCDPAFSQYLLPQGYEVRGGSIANTVYVDKNLTQSS